MGIDRESLHDGLCECGKLKFKSSKLAEQYIANKSRRVYRCKLSETYHFTHYENLVSPKHVYGTHRFKFNADRLLEELKEEMNVLRGKILSYMESAYKLDPEHYKFSSREIIDGVTAEGTNYLPSSIAAEVSRMKKDGTIVSLDEKVPGGTGGAKYCTLPAILDEVTKPTTSDAKSETVGEKKMSDNAKKTETAPKAEVKPTVANPFEKVLAQLTELNSRVGGMAKGYAEVVEGMGILKNIVDSQSQNILAKVSDSEIRLDNEDFEAIATAVVQSVRNTTDFKVIGEYINTALSDLGNDSALIYRIREELDDRALKTEARLRNSIDSLVIKVPEGVSNSEDYKQGIRDGIKMAIDMGLKG